MDWKRPIAVSNNTKIGQLYGRLNTKPTIQNDEVDMGRIQSHELINNATNNEQQEGEGGLTYQQADDYMDFDDYDVSLTYELDEEDKKKRKENKLFSFFLFIFSL